MQGQFQRQTHLCIQDREISWDKIRFVEILSRSLSIVLEDQSRIRFEFASPELLDEALKDAFQAN